MKLYLAHPVDSKVFVRIWELTFEERSGIELVNPFFDIPKPYDPNASRYVLQKVDPKVCVETDLAEIKVSDGLVAIIDGNLSYGVPQEMVYAYLVDKPVYSLITNGEENHPWLRYHSSNIFVSYKELEDFLIK